MRLCARGAKCKNPDGPELPEDAAANRAVCKYCLKDGIAIRSVLNGRSPAKWEELIEELLADPSTKRIVTRIVWWDFGSGYTYAGSKGWAEFISDAINMAHEPIDRNEVVRCLDELGYWDAENRVTVEEIPTGKDRIRYASEQAD